MCTDPVQVEAFAMMERHLVEAGIEMFHALGMHVTGSPHALDGTPTVTESSVAAVIGYVGEKVRGALVLLATRGAVESWRSSLGEVVAEPDMCDTIGEFSNMLLGRLKGHLMPEGMMIHLSTPITATATAGLKLARSPSPSVWLGFDGPGWHLSVRIDATFHEGFELQAPSEQQKAPAKAGDAIFF